MTRQHYPRLIVTSKIAKRLIHRCYGTTSATSKNEYITNTNTTFSSVRLRNKCNNIPRHDHILYHNRSSSIHHRYFSSSSDESSNNSIKDNKNESNNDTNTTIIPDDTHAPNPILPVFPWRTSLSPPPRIAERDDLSGLPNTARARFVRRSLCGLELGHGWWDILVMGREEKELAEGCGWAFQMAVCGLLSQAFQVPMHMIEHTDDGFMKLDTGKIMMVKEKTTPTTTTTTTTTTTATTEEGEKDISEEATIPTMIFSDEDQEATSNYLKSVMDEKLRQLYGPVTTMIDKSKVDKDDDETIADNKGKPVDAVDDGSAVVVDDKLLSSSDSSSELESTAEAATPAVAGEPVVESIVKTVDERVGVPVAEPVVEPAASLISSSSSASSAAATPLPSSSSSSSSSSLSSSLLSSLSSSVIQQYSHIDIAIKPISYTLENAFLVPHLTRSDVDSDETLRGAYSAIENAWLETQQMQTVQKMAEELRVKTDHKGSKRSIVIDVSVQCLERFRRYSGGGGSSNGDDASGNGEGDRASDDDDDVDGITDSSLLEEEDEKHEEEQEYDGEGEIRTHLIRLEMVTTMTNGAGTGSMGGQRRSGQWRIVDIDDMLEGNLWH